MAAKMFFYYQVEGGEDSWKVAPSTIRGEIIETVKPRFVTVLDLSTVVSDETTSEDFQAIKYAGPLYFDLDSKSIDDVCEDIRTFTKKLEGMGLDLECCRYYASGGKGFHIEVPMECFITKIDQNGYRLLPLVYREMAFDLLNINSLDLKVYSTKRGRMWRTPGVDRGNGKFKVPLTLTEALSLTAATYAEYTSAPRKLIEAKAPVRCLELEMLFELKRQTVEAKLKKAGKNKGNADLIKQFGGEFPPSVQLMMDGGVRDGTGFQSLAMQCAIASCALGKTEAEMLKACEGLIETHEGDGERYGSPSKRRHELSRMYAYMHDNPCYTFDVGAVKTMLPADHIAEDLGDAPNVTGEAGDRGFFGGLFFKDGQLFKSGEEGAKRIGDFEIENVVAISPVGTETIACYELDLVQKGRRTRHTMTNNVMKSRPGVYSFLLERQMSFKGTDVDQMSLNALIIAMSRNNQKEYAYPHEGLAIIPHPEDPKRSDLVVYGSPKGCIIAPQDGGQPDFKLVYRPHGNGVASYNADVLDAPDLTDSSEAQEAMGLLLRILGVNTQQTSNALGWFIAAHFRSFYMKTRGKFPVLQMFGSAGSGKTETSKLLSHLYWFRNMPKQISASGLTNYSADILIAGSTSIPMMIDEFKPREMQARRGTTEKVRDLVKNSYTGTDIATRGFINRNGSESELSLNVTRANAPICILGEALETQTAVIERSVMVPMMRNAITKDRAREFDRLQAHSHHVSSLGKLMLERSFAIDLNQFSGAVGKLLERVRSQSEDISERPAYNRAVAAHGLVMLGQLLNSVFGNTFDEKVADLRNQALQDSSGVMTKILNTAGVSETAKWLNALALLSHEDGERGETIERGKDYVLLDHVVEINVDRCWMRYLRQCAQTRQDRLFDNADSLLNALLLYHGLTSENVPNTILRDIQPGGRIVAISVAAMERDQVQPFRV